MASATPAYRAFATSCHAKPVKIGLLTDIHHADSNPKGTRYYRESLGKVKEAVGQFRAAKVNTLIQMGDLIDSGQRSTKEMELGFLREAITELRQTGRPTFGLLGNHCLSRLSKNEVIEELGQKSTFMSLNVDHWKIIMLDACFRDDGLPYNAGNYQWTESDIPQYQREWLANQLSVCDRRTIVFCHQRLDLDKSDPYAVTSSAAVRKILADSKKVAAVFMGHSHTNNLNVIDGIPYITQKAVVEGSGEENNAYSILELHRSGQIKLTGFRKVEDHPFAVATRDVGTK